jgi:dTDP-4-dehydrorhamnose reductase
MRWIVVGANGMLGQDLVAQLGDRNVTALDKSVCDVTDINSVWENIHDVDVVVNCAAYTAVDDAETNQDLAFQINAKGPENLAKACQEIDSILVHISTDYVFAGDAKSPYTENETGNPKSIYGASKWAGEEAVRSFIPENHYIIRTAWLYGKNGNNFGKTILKLASSNDELKVVDDQLGQPTWTKDLANKIIELVETKAPFGNYHGTSSGQVTWYGLARSLFKLSKLDPERIKPVTTEFFPRPAPRPSYSVLGHETFEGTGVKPIRNWHDALKEAFNEGVFNA